LGERQKLSDGDRERLRTALDTGERRQKKHTCALGYEPGQRLGKPKATLSGQIKTNFSGLPTLHDVLAQLATRQNNGPKT
jgi:hypothetical protein